MRADGAGRMLAIWALSAFVLFSLVGGKQLHYLLPELPAFAILVARPAGRTALGASGLRPARALCAGGGGCRVRPGAGEGDGD
ncbi:MAG: hypothetical protein HZT43_12445 [Exiguobacterium profundum]|nr:MAG: hypothetical protein HZT43_12445 [Exiguobacterium profundum]